MAKVNGSTLSLSQPIELCEVGPRDGFQMEREFIPTDAKVALIDELSETGLSEIQMTAFVHPQAIPQLADAEDVARRIKRRTGVTYRALVVNHRGAERALLAGVDALDLVVSVSDTHSLRNANMPTDSAMTQAATTVKAAREAHVPIVLALATALGCPFEGFPPLTKVLALLRQGIEEFGVNGIALADTAGMANPALVHRTVDEVMRQFPHVELRLHLHNTRGMALANLLTAAQLGVTRFDTGIAGIGGCPYAPGATGNVATEDVVNMFLEMGLPLNIDLSCVLEVATKVQRIVGHSESALLRAGSVRELLDRTSHGRDEMSVTAVDRSES